MFGQSMKPRHHIVAIVLAHLATVVAIGLCFSCASRPAHGGVATTGDVQPADPMTWTSDTDAYVGKTSDGTLSITSGGTVTNAKSYIGYNPGTKGTVTVDGTGSTWNNKGFGGPLGSASGPNRPPGGPGARAMTPAMP